MTELEETLAVLDYIIGKNEPPFNYGEIDEMTAEEYRAFVEAWFNHVP